MSDLQIVRRLQRLYKDETTAKVLDWIKESGHDGRRTNRPSGWEYDVAITEVRELGAEENAQLDLQRWKIVEVFKNLEKAKIGQFIIGRRDWESRFQWYYEPKSVAQCARGGSDVLIALKDDSEVEDLETQIQAKEFSNPQSFVITQKPSTRVHRYWLRRDYEVAIELPIDLTSEETKALAAFVEALRTSHGAPHE